MKKLRKIFAFSLSLCLCTTSLLGLSFAEEAASAVPDTVGQALSALVTDYGATSAQIALWEGGAITQTDKAGVYSKSENRALTEDVLYGIGSVSKIYATAAVMKLVDEKKVELDAPLTTYIPEFTMADERYKDITVRMLMNHSSGLHGSSFTNAMLFDDVDPYAHDQLLSQLSTQSLKADPGAFSVYCNDGFTLLEILAERVTGKDFTAIVHEFFTQPLSLNETKTPSDDFDRAMLAKIYSPVRQEALPTEVLNVYGAGGIYASARDLASFGGVFTNQSTLLSQEAKNAMAQPEYKKGLWPAEGDMGMSYGLGWDSVETFPFNRYGITALSKGGDTQFFHASLVVLPEYGLSAAVVSSGGSSQLNGMVAAKLLLETLKSKGIIDEIKPDTAFAPMEKQEMPPELMANSGLYGASSQTVKLDVAENGTLTLTSVTLPTMPAQTFSYVAGGVFCDEAQTLKLSFCHRKRPHLFVDQGLRLCAGPRPGGV